MVFFTTSKKIRFLIPAIYKAHHYTAFSEIYIFFLSLSITNKNPLNLLEVVNSLPITDTTPMSPCWIKIKWKGKGEIRREGFYP